METQYFENYSQCLGRNMELKVYGHSGKPVIYIPCQDGRFYDFESFHMDQTLAPFIESGRCIVFSVDTMDAESWSAYNADPAWRIKRHEQWMAYIVQEVVPFIREYMEPRGGRGQGRDIVTFGCSLGATHALNLYLRFPQIFSGCLALSGMYTAEYYFGSYMDENVYLNSPEHYLGGMPEDHEFIKLYDTGRAAVCVGQGRWEIPESTRNLDKICREHGIRIWFDYWGWDVDHDWPWWYKQAVYFMPYVLGPEEQ